VINIRVIAFNYNDYKSKCGGKNDVKGSDRSVRMSECPFWIYFIFKTLIINTLWYFKTLFNSVLSN